MKTSSHVIAFGIAVFAVALLWATWSAATGAAQTPALSRPEQALINDLVLANRMLASEEFGFLDAFGHVSVRSRSNPSHYYIARSASPGIVTANDVIENGLDSKPVSGERNDQCQERFIDGEIYKARSDVKAIVYSHTPELAAFGVSSVPLLQNIGLPIIPRSGDNTMPIFDIRAFNNGRSGMVSTPALGHSLSVSLGDRPAILLLGHGAVIAGPSIYNLITNAYSLRRAAQIQQQLIAMGGQWDSNPMRVAPNATALGASALPVVPTGTGGGSGLGDRAWEYWKQIVTPQITSPNNLPRADNAVPHAAAPDQALIDDLVYANRILSHRVLGILDALGHVSVRNSRNPNHYFISRYVSAAFVTASDIIENDLDSNPVAGLRSDQYQEVYMHGEIYKARPDVMAILHAHTQEIVPFTASSVTLRPVIYEGTFIGKGLPIHDIRKFDLRETLIRTRELGRSVAIVLADRPAVLLKGHGFALTDPSLHGLVVRAYQLRLNAKIQQEAIALGGKVTYLDQPEEAPLAVQAAVPPGSDSGAGGDRTWEYAWNYWKQLLAAK